MIRGIFTFLGFASVIFFPWSLTALIALGLAPFEPLAPLALGVFSDTLYYVPGAGFPLASIMGLLLAIVALLVRRRLSPGIIGE